MSAQSLQELVEAKTLLADEYVERASFSRGYRVRNLAIGVLLLSNLASLCFFSTHLATGKEARAPESWARVDPLPTKWVQYKWNTPWGSNNDTEADLLWDNILTSHGHLAVNHDWASQRNWPLTMAIPKESNKRLYLLESYHQLHCLRIVRKTLLETARGEIPTFPVTHSRHCLDTLRQHILCHADNTPLYTIGDHKSGDGQWHKCKDWGALRDFATGKTACFRDMSPGSSLEEHFGYCDNGTDGLP